MKKLLLLSIAASSLMFAFDKYPIHDIMDHRVKGKSFGGMHDDTKAEQDGLGILPLNAYTFSRAVDDELVLQRVVKDIHKKTVDPTLKTNIIEDIRKKRANVTGDNKELLTIIGFDMVYTPGSLSSCAEIDAKYDITVEGDFLLSNGNTVTCRTDGTQKPLTYQPGTLVSCQEIYNEYGIPVEKQYVLSSGKTVTCQTNGTEKPIITVVKAPSYADQACPGVKILIKRLGTSWTNNWQVRSTCYNLSTSYGVHGNLYNNWGLYFNIRVNKSTKAINSVYLNNFGSYNRKTIYSNYSNTSRQIVVKDQYGNSWQITSGQ